MQKLVSIITPSYNSSRFISQTIQSVLNQTYSNFEMIIVDDCSADNTSEIIKKHQKEDDRIHFIQLEENSGPAIARNKGIEKATGSFMTFLDADDIWNPDFIEKSIQTILTTGVSFVFSSYERRDEELNPLLDDFIVPNKVTYRDILKSNSISCLTAFLDIEKLGKKYMPLIRKRQDMGLWLRYLKEIDYAHGIQEPMATYRIRKSSLSRDKKALLKYQWEFYMKVEKLGFLPSIYYMLQWMARGFLKYKN